MCMFRLGIIRFDSLDSRAFSRGRIPIVRPRHLRTRGKRTLPLSESSSGINSFLSWPLIVPPESSA
jgi:hypothetical protein